MAEYKALRSSQLDVLSFPNGNGIFREKGVLDDQCAANISLDDSDVEVSDRVRLLSTDNDGLTVFERSVTEPLVIRRRVGLVHGVAIVVGQIIGSGIFISPTLVLKNCGSVGLTIGIWIFGGFLSLLGTMCYCELGTMIEKSGGDFVYLKISYGKMVSFLYGWLNVWLLDPASLAIQALTFSLYFLNIFKPNCDYEISLKLLASISIVFFAALNCISISLTARTQVVFTGAKLIGISIIVGVGFIQLVQGRTRNFNDIFANTITNPGMLGHAVYGVMWSYGGWNSLNSFTEEVKNPEKNFHRCMYISIPLVTLCYVFINISYLTVLSPPEMLASQAVAFTFADKLSPVFGTIMPLIVAISCFGSINSSIFGASRILFSISRENQLPEMFSFIHRQTQTPVPAILLRAVLGLLMLLPTSIEPLLNCLLFVEWIVFGLMFVAVILLRWRKPHLPRPYKVPLVIPILLIPISLYFIATPFLINPIESVIGITLIVTGVPLYYVVYVKEWIPKKVSRLLGKMTYMCYLLCNVVKPATPNSFSQESSY